MTENAEPGAMPTDAVMYPFKRFLPAPIYYLVRALRAAGVGFCFAAFWGGSLIIGWLIMPLVWLWPGTRATKLHRMNRFVRQAYHLFHFTMKTLRLYDRRTEATALRADGVPADQPCVIVSNHPTLCDVTSISSLFPNIVAIARPSLANNPLLRPLVRAIGYVPVGLHMLREAEERLKMGFDVLIFPEGTRTPLGGPLRTFHRGAFELAKRANVPIVLVALTCEPPALTKRLPIWKHPDRMAVNTVRPFAAITPGSSSRGTAHAVEQRYRDVLGYSGAIGGAP